MEIEKEESCWSSQDEALASSIGFKPELIKEPVRALVAQVMQQVQNADDDDYEIFNELIAFGTRSVKLLKSQAVEIEKVMTENKDSLPELDLNLKIFYIAKEKEREFSEILFGFIEYFIRRKAEKKSDDCKGTAEPKVIKVA